MRAMQVQATSVNPTDCKLRSGMLQQLYPLSLPVILGCDLAGVVPPTPTVDLQRFVGLQFGARRDHMRSQS